MLVCTLHRRDPEERASKAGLSRAPRELNLERGAVLQSVELWEHLGNLAFGGWQVAPNGPQCRVKDQFTHHQADVWSSFPEPGPKPGS